MRTGHRFFRFYAALKSAKHNRDESDPLGGDGSLEDHEGAISS
jgi:hypothetical protein